VSILTHLSNFLESILGCAIQQYVYYYLPKKILGNIRYFMG